MSYHQLSFHKYLINVIIVIFSLNVSFAKAQILFPEEHRQVGKLPQAKWEVVLNNSNLSKQPERIFASYYYLGNDAKYRPNYDLKAKYDEGLAKVFTLAFIVGRGGCEKADWDSEIGLEAPKEQVNELRSSGGEIVLSFGGNVSKEKQELAFYCKQPTLLKAQYSKIIGMYQASRLDFDIEGLSLPQTNDLKTDPVMADVERRNRVLAELQTEAAEKGTQLQISFTLAVGQNGLKDESLWVIENAIKNNVKITHLNLMTMYFGQINPNVGSLAVLSVRAAFEQLQKLTGMNRSALWQMIGMTVNIGREENAKEVFSLHDGNKDAETVFKFATDPQTPIGLLSMWVINRDQPCGAGNSLQNNSQENCHGLILSRNEFAKYFNKFPKKP